MLQVSETLKQRRLKRDIKTVRALLRRIKDSKPLASLNLLGRRNPTRMLEYLDRRFHGRSAVNLPFYCSPVEFDVSSLDVVSHDWPKNLAFTRDVSLRGIGFTHIDALDSHYAEVVFDLIDDEAVSLLLEIRWANREFGCSFTSGGLFLGVIEPSSPAESLG